jgi:hypothetical protein
MSKEKNLNSSDALEHLEEFEAKCADDINYYEKAEKLWQLLDDIDTASDIFKPRDEASYKAFYNYTMRKCEERGKYLHSLDGYTLEAPEVTKYNLTVEENFKKMRDFTNSEEWTVNFKKRIDDKEASLKNDEEKSDYAFKWYQLVIQEIKMWIMINKIVDQEEFDSMCKCRGFDDDMREYLFKALNVVELAHKDLKIS